jgi:transcriptional antiterminator NusG
MPSQSSVSGPRWFAVQTLSNSEGKAKRFIDRYKKEEEMEEYIFEVLMPTESVTEIKDGKKKTRDRKLYPGYLFINMRLYDDDGNLLREPWYFVKDADGVIGFVGGEQAYPLKEQEIDRILKQVKEAEGKEVPKVNFEVGEEVKINDGPFMNLSGRIDEIDIERGKLKVSVSIFGRYTPVELEFWQVEKNEE